MAIDQEHNITIGIIFPLTGDISDRGRDCLNAAILAFEEINRNGGIVSKEGRHIEMIVADSQGIPHIGEEVTKRLIQDEKVVALIGAYQSSVAIPATQVAEMQKIPFIVNTGISDIIISRDFRYTFRIIPEVEAYADTKIRFLSYLVNSTQRPITRIALLYENTAFGTSSALAERKLLKKAGFEIVSDISYVAEGVTSLHREVRQTLDEHPDAILVTTYLKDSILIRKELNEAGFTGPLIDTAGGTISKDFIQELKEEADGTFSVSEFTTNAAYAQDLNTRFRARFGVNITGDSTFTYQAVQVLKDALERSPTLGREDIRNALAATNLSIDPKNPGSGDRIRFDDNGQNIFSSLTIMQIQNGTWITVWPERYADGNVLLEPGSIHQ